ncbi:MULTISPECIES: helix-turn-helix domain-containing protein [unclassified Streptomyces]|uniref:ArsR/SmtB family transcription factor n=1 Tax=unclassified Streptomyces TaxID=2593676 RepID=UPI002DD94B24|nr:MULTISPECIES: helix-turn-helix domain-containing protein [unclassified Streptomyces]WSA93557.1 helix-turn-helix domain-containing protein [Streptomyces sp. NBC_01795]WSB77927.1 helix-turn-helix domain-containing protein [Streptomyces sp. NBC_01775]WSS13817.1 helix-turn-helix domain-containing protein [Streptomyces sp. NBC_01186]WSS42641.1 helix-turn-helix domain-containing protein [Streptomyces sp. NBC_01187]
MTEQDDEPRRTISDPGTLKALAHPLRLKILRRLGTSGPATATTLAAVLGENTGTLSYHLRQLERGGFIEDDPDRSAGGRERWWRGVRGLDVRRPPQEELTTAERAVLGELDRMRMEEDIGLARRYTLEHPDAEGWMRGSRSLTHLTREELSAFHDAYLELVQRFARGPREAAPGSRPIALRWFGVPVDEPEEATPDQEEEREGQ